MKHVFRIIIVFVIFVVGRAESSLFLIHGNEWEGGLEQVIQYSIQGSFLEPVWSSGMADYHNFVVGNLDDDPEDELVLVRQASFEVYNSDESFYSVTIPPEYVAAHNATALITDVDGDNFNELVLQYAMHDYLLIYSPELGTIALDTAIFQDFTLDVAVGNIDGDADLEIVCGAMNNIEVYQYDRREGTYFLEYTIPCPGLLDVLLVGDVNNDTNMEIITGGNTSSIEIYGWNGTDFDNLNSIGIPGYCFGLVLDDFDEDGQNELLSGAASGGTTFNLFRFSGDTWETLCTHWQELTIGTPGLTVADINEDRRLDFASYGETGWSLYQQDTTINFNEIASGPDVFNALLTSFSFTTDWQADLSMENAEIVDFDTSFSLVGSIVNNGAGLDSLTFLFSSADPVVQFYDSTLFIPYMGSISQAPIIEGDITLSIDQGTQGLLEFVVIVMRGNEEIFTFDISVQSPFRQFVLNDHGFIKQYDNPIDLVFTDLNRDGFQDIFAADYGAGLYEDHELFWGQSGCIFSPAHLASPYVWANNLCYTDINNDRLVDIIIVTEEDRMLYVQRDRNTFEEIGDVAGVNDLYRIGQQVIALDYNYDGYLDFVVANGRSSQLENATIYRNNGDESFTIAGDDVADFDLENGQGIAAGDLNNDGLTDIFMANYNTPSNLWIAFQDDVTNEYGFTDRAEGFGVGVNGIFQSVDLVDLNGDGFLDILLIGPNSMYFENQGGELFLNRSAESGLSEAGGMDLIVFDFDRDMDLDVFIAGDWYNAHPSSHSLWENDGLGHFTDRTEMSGLSVSNSGLGYCAGGDVENDGDVDIAIVGFSANAENRFYENTATDKNWLGLRLDGTTSNALGLGAKIWLYAGGICQFRQLTGNGNNSLALLFGLDEVQIADSLRIAWPGGTEQVLFDIDCNQYLTILEGTTLGQDSGNQIPKDHYLSQNYPNPFNPSTTIRYGLPEAANVNLVIYDVRGQVIQTLARGQQSAGSYAVDWNGETADGTSISTGLYFARLVVGNYSQVVKMVYLK